MTLPINVHEVMSALRQFPEQTDLLITRNSWRMLDGAGTQIYSGVSEDELRRALEARAVPTADEVMAAIDGIEKMVNRPWAISSLRRYIEHTRRKESNARP